MRRLLSAVVVSLPLCLSACTSYAVHLYPDPQLFQVIDERLTLTDAEGGTGDPIAVLMRGDSVIVIGERRNNWEYEQDMHDRTFIVYFNSRRAYVPYRSLLTRAQYAGMYGTGRREQAPPAAPAGVPSPSVGTGGTRSGGTAVVPLDVADSTTPRQGDPSGGASNNRPR